MAESTSQAHAEILHNWLAAAAAWTYAPVNYSYVGAVIGMAPKFLADRLTLVSQMCRDRNEPDLTSLVVLVGTGEVGTGYPGDNAAADRRACYDFFRSSDLMTAGS